MDDWLRHLIESGAVTEEDAVRLLAAWHAAEARDRRVREEVARRRKGRRRLALAWTVAMGAVGVALVALVVALAVRPAVREPASVPVASWASADRDSLDAAISRLEAAARRPAAAADLRPLAAAYRERHARVGAPQDLRRAVEIEARAERLERSSGMRGHPVIFGAALGLLVVGGLVASLLFLYNGLVSRDERVEERWAQVETTLQRRLDLVPVLVETVRGYAEHERETLVAVTEARARAQGALRAAAGEPPSGEETAAMTESQEDLSAALAGLLAVAERYPDLEASGNFLALQDQLEGTENRIAVERQRYNDAVRSYNASLRRFPTNLVAGLLGFEPREYFVSRSGADEPVEVGF